MNINSVIRKIVLIQMTLSIALGTATAAPTEENEIASRIEKNTYSLAPSKAISINVTADLDQRAVGVADKLKASLRVIRAKTNNIQQVPSKTSNLPEKVNRLRAQLGGDIEIQRNAKTGTPRQIKGEMLQEALKGAASGEAQDKNTAFAFLRSNRQVLRLKNPDRELKLTRVDRDHLNRRHLRFTQTFRGLPVWPAELIVHLNPEGDVDLMSGAYIPTPRKLTTQALIKKETAY